MEAESVHVHRQATKLDMQVLACRKLGHVGAPLRKHLGMLALIRADTQGSAKMVEHDLLRRKLPQQIEQIPQLRMIQPSLERHSQAMQPGESGTEGGVAVQAGWRTRKCRGGNAGIVCPAVANAFEAPAAGLDMRFQHRVDPLAQQAVGMADNPGASAQCTIPAAFAFAGRGGDKFGFADRLHLLRAIVSVLGPALDKHRLQHVVTTTQVRDQILQQVPVGPSLPEMVVGIDDRLCGVQDFFRQLRQPIRTNPRVVKRLAILRFIGHFYRPCRSGYHPATGEGVWQCLPFRDGIAIAPSNDAVKALRENRSSAYITCRRQHFSHSASSRSKATTAAANDVAASSTAATPDNPGRPCAPTPVVTRGTPSRRASTTFSFTPAPKRSGTTATRAR